MLVHLSCISTYIVDWYPATVDIHSVLAMSHIWTALGSNLSTIIWQSSVEVFHSLLLKSLLIHFPVLENLTLGLHRPHDSSGDECFHLLVARFLYRHSFTVTSLSFITASIREVPIDIAPILALVGRFPHLRQLSLAIGVSPRGCIQISTPLTLAQFLDNHGDTLGSLFIRFQVVNLIHVAGIHVIDDTLQDILRFRHGNSINTLETYLPIYMDIPNLKSAILQATPRFSHTLIAFTFSGSLDHGYLTYKEVEAFVLPFSRQSADTGLKALSLSVDVLSPQLVDLLASTLLGLQKLTLKVQLFQGHKYSCAASHRGRPCRHPHCDLFTSSFDASDNIQFFCLEMGDRVYVNWALRHVVIQPSRPLHHSYFAATAIARCIPDERRMLIGDPPVHLIDYCNIYSFFLCIHHLSPFVSSLITPRSAPVTI